MFAFLFYDGPFGDTSILYATPYVTGNTFWSSQGVRFYP